MAFPQNQSNRILEEQLPKWGKQSKAASSALFAAEADMTRPTQRLVSKDSMCHFSVDLPTSDPRVALAPHYQQWAAFKKAVEKAAGGKRRGKNSMSLRTLLWLSNKNLHTGLHNDPVDNTLTVFRGTKYVLLFPPEDAEFIYAINS